MKLFLSALTSQDQLHPDFREVRLHHRSSLPRADLHRPLDPQRHLRVDASVRLRQRSRA